MTAPSPESVFPDLPDPQAVATTYAEVAQRASHLISEHVQRQMNESGK